MSRDPHGESWEPLKRSLAPEYVRAALRRIDGRPSCEHPATLTVTGRPGARWCTTCGTTLYPDGTQEVRG